MRGQRGVVLLLALNLSLLLGLLAAQALRDAVLQARQMGEQLLRVQAFEAAEASLLEAAALLPGGLPAACEACLPPQLPAAQPDAPWLATASGFALLQYLGASRRAAGVATGERVSLVRVTAMGHQARGRQFLEAVYAVGEHAEVKRISWRQRLREG